MSFQYIPPNKQIPVDLIMELEAKYENLILMGDLNAKIEEFGGKVTNVNGDSLNLITENTSLMIINNKEPTHINFNNFVSDILDWILVDAKLMKFLKSFNVLKDKDIGSDHLPLIAEFVAKTHSKREDMKINEETKSLNYSKADWVGYVDLLEKLKFNSTFSH